MTRITVIVSAVVLAIASLSINGAPPTASTESTADLILPICHVQLIEDIEVPAQATGKLVAVNVREGQYVKSEFPLAQIDDSQAKMSLFAAQTKLKATRLSASDDIKVRHAKAAEEIANKDLQREQSLYQRNQHTDSQLERAQLAAKQAELNVREAEHQLAVAKMSAEVDAEAVKAAEHAVDRHKIIANIDGNVLKVFRDQGEWVREGEPVIQLARMDRLYVHGTIDGSQHNPEEILGKQVTVELKRARDQKVSFHGKITFVGLIEKAGKKFTVRAEVENRAQQGQWVLMPNADVVMRIHLASTH